MMVERTIMMMRLRIVDAVAEDPLPGLRVN